MKVIILALFGFASLASAKPIDAEEMEFSRAVLEGRQTASGCYHHASPTCCIPGVCMCRNGWIYQVNRDQMNAGGHGCDPPWGFIATSRGGHPRYCCREMNDGTVETKDGEILDEASVFFNGPPAGYEE
ncbi:hypothetical protein LZ32DRAFT_328061 [Colletotrichum eremochloae]|nr:hypothetical protein LZ32DRAFT_328061 [Colletotrichum eremochloae]